MDAVRINAQRRHTQVCQRSATEQVQEPKKGLLFKCLVEGLGVDARNGHLGDEPENHQHCQCEQNFRPQIRHAHGVDHRLYKLWS